MPATLDTKQNAGNTNIDFKNKYNKFITILNNIISLEM